MSSRRSVRRILLTLCLAPATLRAQDVAAYERRVDSLAATWRAATAARIAYETRLALDARTFDSVAVGPVRALVTRDTRGIAEAGARAAMAHLRPQYGTALDVLSGYTFVVRDTIDAGLRSTRDSVLLSVAELDENGRERIPQVIVRDTVVVARVLGDLALRIILRTADPELAAWVHATLPSDTGDASRWERARLDLLSSYASVARRCYDADLLACRQTLRLAATSDPVTEWLTPADRGRFVASVSTINWRAFDGRLTAECTGGADSACLQLLRPFDAFPDPISSYHRLGLMQLAMSMGGPGAMQRMLSTPGSVETRLAAAAGVPADSLVRTWVARVRGVHTPSQDMSFMVAATSLGWVLLCGTLASRSSRWR